MKTKEIITIVVAVIVVGASGYFIYNMLNPASSKVTVDQPTQSTQVQLSQEEYDATLKLISEKKDYGEAALDNIGRTNPFGPLN
jgi:hypothetical protein